MREAYAREVTDYSLEELRELARWYNDKLGHYPIIVGGWAAYLYTGGLGSKDIDIVFPDGRSMDATLSQYFASHDYKEKFTGVFDNAEKELVKRIKTGKRTVEIIVDAVSAKRVILVKGGKVRIPWSWAVKNCVEKDIGKASVYLPTLETLMAYKLGAVLGRQEQLRQQTEPAQVQYFRSKVWKDVYDSISLSKFDLDLKRLNGFLEESGLDKYRQEMIEIIDDYYQDGEIRALLADIQYPRIRKLVTGSGDTSLTTKTPGTHNPRYS